MFENCFGLYYPNSSNALQHQDRFRLQQGREVSDYIIQNWFGLYNLNQGYFGKKIGRAIIAYGGKSKSLNQV